MRKFGLFLLFLMLGYGAYPYWSLYRLVRAIEIGNEGALKQYVDWPSVRRGLKEDVSGMISRQTGQAIASGDGDTVIGGTFASAIGNILLEPLINALVTPEGIAAMIREGRAREGAPSPDSQYGRTRRDGGRLLDRAAFAFFTGPTTFEAVFRTEQDEDVICVMQLNDMRWRLIRLRLPSLVVEPQRNVEDAHNEVEAGASESRLPPTGTPMITAIPPTRPVPGPQQRPEEGNAWRVKEEISPLDDSKNVAIWTTSLETVQDTLGRRVSPELALRCSENVTTVYINWKTYIGMDSSEITYRRDKLSAETDRWGIATNFEASGLWNGSSAIPFIKDLFDRKTLLVRITPYAKSPVTAVFNIEGLKDVAIPLMDACHWHSQARPKTAADDQPSPAQEKAEDAFGALVKSVEQLDRRVQSDTTQSGTGHSTAAGGQARSALGEASLSFGEVDALRRQIAACWTLPVGVERIGDLVVQLRIQVRPDRTVQSVTIQDQGRLGRDPIFRALAESARRAVDKCSPLNLPPGKYAVWHDMMMNLYPEDAISG